MANVLHSQAAGIHPGAYHQSTAPGSPVDGLLWVDQSSGPPYQLNVYRASASAWQNVGIVAGGGGPLTVSSQKLAADVTMTTSPTFYDGASLTLAAGTWVLLATITVLNVNTGAAALATLWDGTTHAATAQRFMTASQTETLALHAIVTPSGSTTYKVSAQGTQNNMVIKAQTTNPAGHGNNATYLIAIKLA